MAIATESSALARSEYTAACLLGVCMLSTGAAGLVVEYIIATTTTYILGASIIVWSLVISTMFAAMGFAGWLQERLSDRGLLEKFIAIEVALALLGGFAPLILSYAHGSEFLGDHFNLVLYTLTILIGILVGLEIPVIMRIINELNVGFKANLKIVLGADYIGGAIGGLVWVYLLLPNRPITEIGFIVSGLNFVIAVGTVAYFWHTGHLKLSWVIPLVFSVVSATLVYGFVYNRSWSVALEQKLYDDPIVFQKTTVYQHLVITKKAKASCGSEIRLYINGGTQFASCDETIYHENLVHPVMALVPDHARVLILGGGDGLALREVLKYQSVEQVTLVDLDPEMVRLAKENQYLRTLNGNAFHDARVKAIASEAIRGEGFREIHTSTGGRDTKQRRLTKKVAEVAVVHVDAAKFLSDLSTNYNVIIVDLPDPHSVELNKLYSTMFYEALKRRLAERGAVVVQATSPIHAKEVFLGVGRTMQMAGLGVLPFHDNVPSFGQWGWWIGWKSAVGDEVVRKRFESLERFPVETTHLTPEKFRANLVFGKDGLTGKETAVNRLMDPHLYVWYEKAWKGY